MSYFNTHAEISNLAINPLRLTVTGLLALDAVTAVTSS